MSTPGSGAPPRRVPTLTEVVSWPAPMRAAVEPVAPPPADDDGAPPASVFDVNLAIGSGAGPAVGAAPDPAPPVFDAAPMPAPAPGPMPAPAPAPTSPTTFTATAITDEQLIQRVLDGVQRQIDLMLEYRLRETLTPLLTRAADGIVREARGELAASLRDVVARAVAQELSRHRPR